MNKVIVILLICTWSLLAAMDQWVETGEMVRFRPQTHFTAVGRSNESSEKAKNHAMSELKKQISVSVRASEVYEETDGTSKDKSTSRYRNRARLTTGGDIQGIEIIETAKRGNEYFAFAALSKELFVGNLRNRISQLDDDLKAEYKRAAEATLQSDISTVVSSIGSARNALKEINNARLMLTAAIQLQDSDSPSHRMSDLNALYESVIAGIEVEAISGDDQIVQMGNVPSEPFSIRVTAHGLPVPYMPFVLQDKKKNAIVELSTDLNGEIEFVLGEDAETAKGKQRYYVAPAIQFSGNSERRGKELTRKFVYTVLGDPRFAHISLTIDGGLESDYEQIYTALIQKLAQYDIVQDSCSCQEVAVQLSVEKGSVIQGVSSSRSYTKSGITGTVTVKDSHGRSGYAFSISETGAGSSVAKAVVNALNTVSLKDHSVESKKILVEEHEEPVDSVFSRGKLKLVIFDFHSNNTIANWDETSSVVTSMITTEMINSGLFSIIERNQIAEVVAEKNFAGDDLDFAKLAGAEFAIVGNASMVDNKIELDARLVNMNTGIAVGVASVTGHKYSDLRTLSKLLVEKIKGNEVVMKKSRGTEGSCCR